MNFDNIHKTPLIFSPIYPTFVPNQYEKRKRNEGILLQQHKSLCIELAKIKVKKGLFVTLLKFMY